MAINKALLDKIRYAEQKYGSLSNAPEGCNELREIRKLSSKGNYGNTRHKDIVAGIYDAEFIDRMKKGESLNVICVEKHIDYNSMRHHLESTGYPVRALYDRRVFNVYDNGKLVYVATILGIIHHTGLVYQDVFNTCKRGNLKLEYICDCDEYTGQYED